MDRPHLPRATAAFALCLAACSPEPANTPEVASSVEIVPKSPPPSQATQLLPPVTQAKASPIVNMLSLGCLGALKIGGPVPAGSSWTERGAQIPGACRTIGSPDFPGVHAIVEEGKVRRITLGERSGVKLIEGMGVGVSEVEVRAAFPGFREEPHKYVEKPAKYLTAPNSASGDPALRFEIGRDGKVALIHVGTMPVLGYVEGCA